MLPLPNLESNSLFQVHTRINCIQCAYRRLCTLVEDALKHVHQFLFLTSWAHFIFKFLKLWAHYSWLSAQSAHTKYVSLKTQFAAMHKHYVQTWAHTCMSCCLSALELIPASGACAGKGLYSFAHTTNKVWRLIPRRNVIHCSSILQGNVNISFARTW